MVYKQEYNIYDGELWWGGTVEDGKLAPFEIGFSRNLDGDLLYNQGAPLLLSNKGRYVWSEQSFSFDITADVLQVVGNSEILIGDTDGGTLKSAFKEASKKYFPPSKQMPDMSFFTQPQFNTWMAMSYHPTQEGVITFARNIIKNGFQPGVLMIDDGWQEDFGNWNFHPGRFPDPKAMMKELKDLGFQIMLWICPFISPDSIQARMLYKKGYLINDSNEMPAIRQWWNGYSGLLDCSNKQAVKWLTDQMERLMDTYDVKGFKMDGGDPQYYEHTDYSKENITPNEHCLKWAEIGLDYSFIEYRANWKLGGQHLVNRLSDKNHSWAALQSLIPNTVSQGLLGYSFVCPDMIGGGQYEDLQNKDFKWDQELFVRYTQCAALLPMMQFSTAPWEVLDDKHLKYCLQAVSLHEELEPIIVQLAKEAAHTGEPIIRHMNYEFHSPEFAKIRDQFMLGEHILVAPVLNKGVKTRDIVFPAGTWIGDDQSTVVGPCTVTVHTPISRLPWYRKAEDSRDLAED